MTKLKDFQYGQIQGGRDYQEDNFGVYTDVHLTDKQIGSLFIVCDGMGGHVGGKQASKLARDTFFDAFQSYDFSVPDRLAISLNAANKAIARWVVENPEMDGMGTTLVAGFIMVNQLHWVSVGDSPLWLFRDNSIERLNEDHSLAPVLQKMVEIGELTPEEAEEDDRRHQLRSAVMGVDMNMVDLRIEAFELRPKDLLLAATDGVETLDDNRLAKILAHHMKKPESSVIDLILQEIDRIALPDQDNATAVAAFIPSSSWF